MFPVSRWQPRHWLLTLLCVTLLAARVDGAYLHLCLDGQERASSVHVGPDVTAQAGTQAPHHDVDLSLAGDLLAKLGKGDLKQPVALPATPIAALLAATRLQAPTFCRTAKPSTSSVLLPPLRGPPAFATA